MSSCCTCSVVLIWYINACCMHNRITLLQQAAQGEQDTEVTQVLQLLGDPLCLQMRTHAQTGDMSLLSCSEALALRALC